MSRTYDLFCTACREFIWIGQGHGLYGSFGVYADEVDGDLEVLATFLMKHHGHLLFFDDDELGNDRNDYTYREVTKEIRSNIMQQRSKESDEHEHGIAEDAGHESLR